MSASMSSNSQCIVVVGSTKHIQKLYLQVRSEVKRTKVAEPVTFDYIQQLFQGRFHLNWDAVDGIETSDLPKVYIRDTQSQVFYELEELEDVEDGALLKLHAGKSRHHHSNGFSANSINWTDESVLRQLFPSRSSSPVEDKNFQLPESRPISVSTTTSRCSAQISSTMNDIRHLKSDLSELRLTYSKFVGDFSESLTTLRTHFSSTLPTVAALSDTMSLRQQLEPIKAEMQSLSDSLSSRLSDLADITDTLRLDILQRYTIPPPSKLDFINTESFELKSIVTALNNLLECHDTKWKSLWESELSNVVTEQNSIDSSTTLVESATSQLAQLTTVISQLNRIVELSRTNPDILPRKPQFTPHFHDPDSESESDLLGGENGEGLHEGLPTVLQELQNISIDSERRMKSIKQTEKLRAWERQNKKDEFEEQIQNALKGGLRRSADGGVEELERRRQEKEKEILKSLMSKK
ncbi:actin interacting protein 3 [Paraphysoderma sedebokerense]|nr:actin interacting protein 3 [Paraphysoderma sedebokerense]